MPKPTFPDPAAHPLIAALRDGPVWIGTLGRVEHRAVYPLYEQGYLAYLPAGRVGLTFAFTQRYSTDVRESDRERALAIANTI